MKNPYFSLFFFVFIMSFFYPTLIYASDTETWQTIHQLQAELNKQKKQIEAQQALIDSLTQKLNREASNQPSSSEKKSPSTLAEKKSKESIQKTPSSPTLSSTHYGQIGPFKYPKSNTLSSKLLPDISLIGIFAGAYFTDDPGDENAPNPTRTGFNLQEIELAIQSVVDPYVRADVFIAFHEDEIEVEEAYITTLSLPANLQIRAGKLLLPFGRQNSKHVEKWSFVNNPLINHRIFGGEGLNELGIVPSILFPTPFFFQLETAVSQGTNENNFDGSRKQDFASTTRLPASWDLSDSLTLLTGASAAFGFNGTGKGNNTNIFGGDLFLKWRPKFDRGIDWQTEYVYRHRDVGLLSDNEGGFYTELLGQWNKRWQAGARFDFVGLPKASEQRWRVSPMVRFLPSEFLSFRLQYDFEDSNLISPIHATYLQMIFNLGPHGAHAF